MYKASAARQSSCAQLLSSAFWVTNRDLLGSSNKSESGSASIDPRASLF